MAFWLGGLVDAIRPGTSSTAKDAMHRVANMTASWFFGVLVLMAIMMFGGAGTL